MTVFADKKVEKLEILVNGNIRETLTDRPYKTEINLEPGVYELQGRAKLEGGQEITSGILKIGVGGKKWDENPTPSPTPTPTLTPTPTP